MEYKELLCEITKLCKACHEQFISGEENRFKWYMRGLILEDCLKNIKELEV